MRRGISDLVRRKSRANRCWLAAVALCSAGAAFGADLRLPEGPGAYLVYSKCQTCHDLQYILDGKGLLPAQWGAVLAGMREYGLQIDDAQATQVLQYLNTYFGPNPPPAAPASASAASAAPVDGSKVYAQNCAGCHGATGQGQTGYYPPLAGNPDLASHADLPVLVVLNGLTGPIEVADSKYDSSMPSFGHLSNIEIAAVVNFVRGLGHAKAEFAPVTADAVTQRRQQRMTPAQVHEYRSKLK